jgi:hypothetical protein
MEWRGPGVGWLAMLAQTLLLSQSWNVSHASMHCTMCDGGTVGVWRWREEEHALLNLLKGELCTMCCVACLTCATDSCWIMWHLLSQCIKLPVLSTWVVTGRSLYVTQHANLTEAAMLVRRGIFVLFAHGVYVGQHMTCVSHILQ